MLTIAELRAKNNKMSQKELAEIIGTSQANISNWEKNPLSMSSKNLVLICKVFKVKSDDILGINEQKAG
ncbi:helix-turn-helix domain-containing protein [Paenilisteria newyorkensis]|uniref:helix-turn-helix domain-containing protein n=1 Tax=Listeria newyorkensis TaxID=1497681 RepID=UPI000669F4CA|nr:helix-turn-helix family protein [Listeria newyorkensis]